MAFDEGRRQGGRFFLTMEGEMEEVTEEVYRAYLQFTWREKKVQQKESGDIRILSLDRMFEEESFETPRSCRRSVEDTVIMKMEVEALHQAISELAIKDQALVKALYLDKHPKTTVQLAREMQVSHQMISKRRGEILKALREEMKEWE